MTITPSNSDRSSLANKPVVTAITASGFRPVAKALGEGSEII